MGLFKKNKEPTESVGPAQPMLVQPMQPQVQYQQMPMQMQPQMQQIKQQVAQPQIIQPEKRALIVGIEILQDGEYAFKVVTNYQLEFGECQIVQ
jgi:hypothetical protein